MKIITYAKICILITCLSLLCKNGFAQHKEKSPNEIEDLVVKINDQIRQKFKTVVGISDKEVTDFTHYYIETVTMNEGLLYKNIEDDSVNNKTIQTYENIIVKQYQALYSKYLSIPIADRTARPDAVNPAWPGACNTGCLNTDFEQGSLNGWMGCEATNNYATTGVCGSFGSTSCTGVMTGGTTSSIYPTTGLPQVNLTSAASRNDPVCGAFIPQLCPSGGKYSVEIGDYDNPHLGTGILEQSFTVSPANSDFTYWYAVVLENPNGHAHCQQPYFHVFMYDQNGNLIPFCGNYAVTADSASAQGNFKGFYYPGSNDTCYCRPWTPVFVPLKKYIGQCVTIQIITGDCSKGGHFGYAYFDAHCGTLGIITSAPAICGNPITLTGPTGGASYQWTGPGAGCIIGPSNTQTITVSCPGKYTVIVQSYIGAACADTLDTIIASSTGAAPVPYFKADTVCVGSVTQFTNLTNPATGNTYKWNFGDPGSGVNDTSSATNPTHTYPAAGTYTVNLSAVASGGAAGCGGDTNLKVVVNGNAVAGFKATTVCLNNPTVFTDTSQGASSWKWNFGEPSSGANNVSNKQNPTHTYATAGTFNVTLIIGTAPCTDTSIQHVTVNPLPTAAFTYSAACFGQTTTFADASTIAGGTITTWSWNFGDPASGANNVSSLQNPTHTYGAAGSYPVTLTVTSNLGCQSTIKMNIVVSPVPVAAFTATTVCRGQATTFKDGSSVSGGKITGWNWNFGDNTTSTVQNPVHVYATSGTYAVKLIVSTGGCTDSVVDSVKVNPVPTPKFKADTVCQGNPTTFTDLSTIGGGGTITGWAWNFGDLSVSTLKNPTHIYANAGTYAVSLTVMSNNNCDSTYTLPVIVNPLPKAAFTATTPCFGTATQFTDKSTISSGSIVSWSWNFGDAGTSNIQNPSHNYSAAGTYPVTLKVTSIFGCVDSITQNVTVDPQPVPLFSSPTTGCVPFCVTFNDSSSVTPPATITNWLWNFGDGSYDSLAITATPSHCYTKVGTFSVTLTVTTNNGCAQTLTRPSYITTWPVPVANFTASPNPTVLINNPTVNFIDLSTGSPVSWTWETFGDALDSVKYTENTTHTYQDTGTFYVKLLIVNKYGCTDSIIEPVIVQPVWTFYVPNAFTPNGDDINDGFIGKGIGILNYQMWIFDRWGMLLYHCTDMNKPWDGKVQNSSKECQEDTYVWLIEITDVFHNNHRYIGRVTLIK